SDPETVTLILPIRMTGVHNWDTFSTDEALNGGTITYRLTDDEGTTWKYWNGSAWVASADLSEANDTATVNTHISTFPVSFHGIAWQAILAGDGQQRVTLNSLTIESTSDTDEPSVGGSTISAFKVFGGSALASNDWTNGASPYFSWDVATD